MTLHRRLLALEHRAAALAREQALGRRAREMSDEQLARVIGIENPSDEQLIKISQGVDPREV